VRWARIIKLLRDDPDTGIGLIVVGFAVILGATGDAGLTGVSWTLTAISGTLLMLLVSIVRDRLAGRSKDKSPTVFPTQDGPYSELVDYINQNKVTKAVFLQYSGQACAGVLEAVLKKPGAKAVVYLQDEKTAESLGSKFQAARIGASVKNMRKWRIKYEGKSEIIVRKCTMPMSVRAIMLDDQLLCMGWYTYEHEHRQDVEHPDDTVAVSGHDTATLISRKGTADFDALTSTLAMLVANYEQASLPVRLLPPSAALPASAAPWPAAVWPPGATGAPGATGTSISKVEPWPGTLRTRAEPWCAWAMACTMGRPRPKPPASRLR